VAEIGAGPWTQTLFLLGAQPDVSIRSLTVIDPGIPGYLAGGRSSYQNGTILPRGRTKPVRVLTLAMGAEQVPSKYDEHFDTVVMINCVEHTFNAFATLFSAYRLLKPGGLFVFHERSVRLSVNYPWQIYHPVRLSKNFLKWFEDTLYQRLYQPQRPPSVRGKPFLESLTYYIGRKK